MCHWGKYFSYENFNVFLLSVGLRQIPIVLVVTQMVVLRVEGKWCKNHSYYNFFAHFDSILFHLYYELTVLRNNDEYTTNNEHS